MDNSTSLASTPPGDGAHRRRRRPAVSAARRFLPHLFLLLLLSLAGSARAAVRFDVFVGYDGIVPEASWFPVAFEVSNDGPSFTGLVELSPSQYDQSQTRVMVVELPTGTLKRFVIPVFSSGRYAYSWNARLLDERGKVRAETQGIRVRKQNQWDMPLLGAVTRTPPVLPEIKPNHQNLEPLVARLQPSLFPDNPLALEGLSALYLSSERALELKVNQVTALLAWLNAGGHLVIGVEQILHVNGNEWLRPLLPCELTGMTTLASHPELQEWVTSNRRRDGEEYVFRETPRRGSNRTPPAEFANPFAKLKPDQPFEEAPLQVATGTLRDGRVLIGSASAPLAVMAKRGRGQLTVLLFCPELEPFSKWVNRPFFWAKMMDLPPELLATEQYNRYGGTSSDGVFGAMIDSRQVRKLPVGWLLLLLVGYLVVIGPLDQYWLKKINRQMLTWLTFPLYVALFSVLIYVIGYKLRAGETEWNELHVVDVLPRGQKAELRGRTYASIYSPVNAKYKLASDLPFATLRGEFLSAYSGGQEASRASVEQRGNSFQAEISVPVWTSQLYVSDWWQPGAPPVTFSVTPQANGWQVRVDNRLETPLGPLNLVIGDRLYPLGELPARQAKTFNVVENSGQLLRAFVQSHAGSFHHYAIQRQRAFGSSEHIQDLPNSSMALSFDAQLRESGQHGPYSRFITPPGLELSPLVESGSAVLLAWAPNHAPVKPMRQFSTRRSHRDTLWRVAAEVEAN